MDAKTVLQMQLTGSFNLVRELTESASPEEWVRRPFPGANLVGFTLWHCARSIDWAVQRAVRGVPEIADSVAHRVSRETLAEYLQAVQQEVVAWISDTRPEELERRIDLRARQQDRPGYLAPSLSHIRVHYGEVQSQLQLLRV